MSWVITETDGVALVQMTSSKVNKQNDDMFRDLQEAFDRLDAAHTATPVILTGQGNVFSAGLDFEYTFPIFARADVTEIGAWFRRFSSAILRVFNHPYPTVAAVNGHAIAGGLILAVACDHRVAAAGEFRCGINEIHVGIPMPSLYLELLRYRLGSPVTAEATLTGQLYSNQQGHERGFYQELVAPDQVMDRAMAHARRVPRSSMDAYAHSKAMLQYPTMKWIETESRRLDETTFQVVTTAGSRAAQAAALQQLKAR